MPSFSSIVGQAKAVSLLRRALAGGRLAHGYLLTGPEGVGKATTARALAAKLLCQRNGTDPPCCRCPGCRMFAADSHPDFLQIRPDGASIKINQIRELKKALAFPPFALGMRAVLIEETQSMGREAANSLLKVLEEPPPDNILLLVASDAEPVLDTILSRCQVVPFAPLSDAETAAVLCRAQPQLAPDEARLLAQLTGGCPGLADALQNSAAISLRQDCLGPLLAGAGSQAEAVELAIAMAPRLVELKDDVDVLFDLLTLFFKEAMVAALSGREPQDGQTAAACERWDARRLAAMVEAIEAARSDLARNCSRALVCETLLLELFCG